MRKKDTEYPHKTLALEKTLWTVFHALHGNAWKRLKTPKRQALSARRYKAVIKNAV